MGISKTSNLGRENGVEKRVGVWGEGVGGGWEGWGGAKPCRPSRHYPVTLVS